MFVKRIYPLKINAGGFLNFSIPIASYSFDGYDEYGDYIQNDDMNILFRTIPGARVGAEFLAGDRVGFTADFVFQWLTIDMDFDFDELDLESISGYSSYQDIYFPAVGGALGVNIYF
jgi:hypothetical protein